MPDAEPSASLVVGHLAHGPIIPEPARSQVPAGPYAVAMAPRTFQPGQRAELWLHDIETGTDTLRHTSHEVLYEAPNWTPDGDWLILNGDGKLLRIAADGPASDDPTELVEIDRGGIATLNNDHVLSPDGRTVYVSADDAHIYAVPIEGGSARRITNDPAPGFMHFLHGVSPDDQTLAYIGLQLDQPGDWTARFTTDIYTIPTSGGPDVRLTDGGTQHDGSEYSPDGEHLWFSSERASTVPGHAQVFRLELASGAIEQLTDDERVNWFPHVSPDGNRVVYISFPPGTLGHPANLPVILRELHADGTTRDLVHLFGGQGTINVNSWAPDSKRFAYVTYPIG